MLSFLLVFLFGLVIGSFLNVVIARVPERQSVITPRSRCPHCSTPIAPYDNIPVLSFLWLRGRCRHCREKIAILYPVVELLTGLAFVAAYGKFDWTPSFPLNALFFSALIALIFIDLRHRILPDIITLPLILIGLFLSYIQDPSLIESRFLARLFDLQMPWQRIAVHATASLLGILLGGGALWAVAVAYLKLRKIEGMGMGDVKLMAAVGAFLGWSLAWLTIFIGSLLGAIIGSAYIASRRKGLQYELPFGTFLGFAAIVSALWGPDLIDWYSSFYR
ncbi:MAG TPA: prepilin peptidase [Acidobacteriota bacterium]|jgi:leader peptidase (prepilin peptidase)/N-methyltransferase|nr:prepilin peptidase [Acidobacteriota bacterium]